jgi:hypothetical protein
MEAGASPETSYTSTSCIASYPEESNSNKNLRILGVTEEKET